jgi:hypothetical protein
MGFYWNPVATNLRTALRGGLVPLATNLLEKTWPWYGSGRCAVDNIGTISDKT